VALTVEPQSGATDFVFEQQGDIVEVADIATLELAPLDEVTGEWGMVLMRLQADIPDATPGTNVTFLLFGDVTIENVATAEQNPMQAFYLQTGIGDAPCETAPDSGVMIQTPDGVETVSFNINGVDVEIGSTVLFQAQPDAEMTISPIEGAAVIELEGEAFSAIAGTSLRIPIGADLRPSGLPPLPESYTLRDVQGLPVGLMQRPIGIEPPLSAEGQALLHETINQGLPPCGVDPLPPCVNALNPERARTWAMGERWGATRPPRSELFPGLQNFQPPLEGTPQFPLDGTRPPLLQGTPRLDGTRPPLLQGTRPPLLQGTPLVPNQPAGDNRPCIYPPGPGDPPLPASETRPFCPTPAPGEQASPPPLGNNPRPPLGEGQNPPLISTLPPLNSTPLAPRSTPLAPLLATPTPR
jgi:hypothetical protein